MEPSSTLSKTRLYQDINIRKGLREWHVINWCVLGWFDFIYSHRRTLIGPLWQTLQVAIWAAGLVIVFGPYHADNPNYIPYVVSGLVVWGWLSTSLIAGTNVFVSNSSLILNIPNPLTLYIIRSLSMITIRTGFQLLVFIPVAVYYKLPLNAGSLLLIPGIIITLLCFGNAMMIVGVIGARMRDLEHIMSSAMRFLIFATPIFWIPNEGTYRFILAKINPLTWFVDLIRMPLLGETPSIDNFVACSMVTLISMIAAYFVQRRYGRFVPTWL